MCLRLETRNEMKQKELNEKVKTTSVAHQLCRRRVQLFASFKNIGIDDLNGLLQCAKVWQKDWIKHLRDELDNHGLKTKCDQDNWLHNPTTKLKFTDGGDFEANAIGKRSQTVQYADENCGRIFYSTKEMYRHLRDNHSETTVLTSDAIEIETDKGVERTVEIPSSPASRGGGPEKSNLTTLCPTATRLMSMSAVGLSTCKTATRL